MKVLHYDRVKAEEVSEEGAKDVKIRWLISDKDGAPNFAMRMLEVEPEGYTPFHNHPWEHEVYILRGMGVVVGQEGEKPFSTGDVVYVSPNEQHNFKNTGSEKLQFLCIVPWPHSESK